MRPSWDEFFLKLAFVTATRATCDRKHVGAVLASADHRVAACGYNGSPTGMSSCDEVGHELVQTAINADGTPKMSCVRTIHAESNALSFAGRMAQGCTLYLTCSSCLDCAKLAVQAGISRVVYAEYYSSRYGKSGTVDDFFREAGLQVEHFESPGLTLFRKQLDEADRLEREVLRTTQVEYTCGCSHPGDVALERCSEHKAPKMA